MNKPTNLLPAERLNMLKEALENAPEGVKAKIIKEIRQLEDATNTPKADLPVEEEAND